MHLNNMIYFSRHRLRAFFPDRAPHLMPTVKISATLPGASVEIGTPSPRGPSEAELNRLRQVRHELRNRMSHFYAPDLRTGEWIHFDLRMGWSTTHKDSDLPDLDDVLIFFGSLPREESPVGRSVDLMLCGSTEHLLQRTATAGPMGSGTNWLHRLILKINGLDETGSTDIPQELTHAALSAPRINRPETVSRWVFDVIARHHSPRHRARVQGLARVDLNIEGDAMVPQLIVATPLYVQDASVKPLRWLTRLRLHRDLCRRYNRSIWNWQPDLPSRDRNRFYQPPP
ncbi:SAVMC3_10250 family protein [Kitasatospora purpeofusca]|uniref:SAVMC3_10250 family protein n=1 Tax=Kitasatospora purpeofusca TaxID=67352 RepID=UPI00386C3B2B